MARVSQSRISIFVRVLIPLLLAMACFQILMFTAVRPFMKEQRRERGEFPGRGRAERVEIVQEFIQSQRDEIKLSDVKNFSEEEKVDVVYGAESEKWSSSPSLPSWKQILESIRRPVETGEFRAMVPGTGMFYGYKRGSQGFAVSLKRSRWAGPPPRHGRGPGGRGFWVPMGLQTLLVIFVCYGVLVWQLRPIKWLMEGVKQLGAGNLSYKVPVHDKGELGILSESFNETTEKLAAMMRAKEELLLGVSHELRSPLASMKVCVELLDDEKRKTQLGSYISQMETMVNELLDSHRIASGVQSLLLQSTDLKTLLKSLVSEYGDREVKVNFICDLESAVVKVDAEKIQRLVRNLIENALKYSKESDSAIEVSLMKMEKEWEVSVADSGEGIPSEELQQIFEPFHRVDKSRNKKTGGFGLGLYLCRKIAEGHGGRIWAENRPRGGARLVVRLPEYT